MKSRAYTALSGVVGALMVALGVLLFLGFLGSHAPGATGGLPIGPNGYYFVAFTACCLIAWGGCLLGQLRSGQATSSVATATALGLFLSAVYRMIVWFVGDYHAWPGNLVPRVEAGLFLLLALAFLWLRPERLRAKEA